MMITILVLVIVSSTCAFIAGMAVERRISAAVSRIKTAVTIQKKKNTGVVKIGVNNSTPVEREHRAAVVHKRPPRQDELTEGTNAALASVRARTGSQ